MYFWPIPSNKFPTQLTTNVLVVATKPPSSSQSFKLVPFSPHCLFCFKHNRFVAFREKAASGVLHIEFLSNGMLFPWESDGSLRHFFQVTTLMCFHPKRLTDPVLGSIIPHKYPYYSCFIMSFFLYIFFVYFVISYFLSLNSQLHEGKKLALFFKVSGA